MQIAEISTLGQSIVIVSITQRSNKDKPCKIVLVCRKCWRPDHHKRIDVSQRLMIFCHIIDFTQLPALNIKVEYGLTHLHEDKLSIVPRLLHSENSMLVTHSVVCRPQGSKHLTQTNGIHQRPIARVTTMKPDAKFEIFQVNEINFRVIICLCQHDVCIKKLHPFRELNCEETRVVQIQHNDAGQDGRQTYRIVDNHTVTAQSGRHINLLTDEQRFWLRRQMRELCCGRGVLAPNTVLQHKYVHRTSLIDRFHQYPQVGQAVVVTISKEELLKSVHIVLTVELGQLRNDGHASRRAERAVHSARQSVAALRGDDDDAAVRAVPDEGVEVEARAAADGGKLRRLRQHLDEARVGRACGVGGYVEAEGAERVELAETAEEGRVGGVGEPPLADEGRADEVGGEGEADDDLAEEVVVAKDLRFSMRGGRRRRRRRRRRGGRARPLGIHGDSIAVRLRPIWGLGLKGTEFDNVKRW